MGSEALDSVVSAVRAVPWWRHIGRICEISAGTARVTGLSKKAAHGDRVSVALKTGTLYGEVLQLDTATITILMDEGTEGLSIADEVILIGRAEISPMLSWVGRILDPYGQPLDGKPLAAGGQPRSLQAKPPNAAQRRPLGDRLETGLCAFNTFLPLVRGQRLGIFAGSGVGKSQLLGSLVRGVEADIVVVALIGERGREVRAFTEQVLGEAGMARSIVVAATSDQPAVARRRCALTAMTIAEFFRDQGLHVFLVADSITRFAEAHREIALAGGEAASLKEFPPSTAHAIMSLAERAGPGGRTAGDITAVFSVLVAGSDMEGVVADVLRGTLDGHVILDRTIAERGRYPAIDLLRSVSRSLPEAASAWENQVMQKARELLGAYQRSELMIRTGLYSSGSDTLIDEAIRVWRSLDRFVGGDELHNVNHSFAILAAIVGMDQAVA